MPRSLLMLALAAASFPNASFRRFSTLFDIRHPLPAQRSDQLVVADGAGMVGWTGPRRVGCVRRTSGSISRGQFVPFVAVIGEFQQEPSDDGTAPPLRIAWIYDAQKPREPLALIETARDVGQQWKGTSVSLRLARRARLPCYVVLYAAANDPNPAEPRYRDIRALRVRRVWPKPEAQWRTLTPNAWANALLQIRAWSARRIDIEAANDPQYGERDQ
jgi:hypothetical protein